MEKAGEFLPIVVAAADDIKSAKFEADIQGLAAELRSNLPAREAVDRIASNYAL